MIYLPHLRSNRWSLVSLGTTDEQISNNNNNNAPKSSSDSIGVFSFTLIDLWCLAVPYEYQLGKQGIVSRGIQEWKLCTVVLLLLLVKWSGFRRVVRILLPCQPSKRDTREMKVTKCKTLPVAFGMFLFSSIHLYIWFLIVYFCYYEWKIKRTIKEQIVCRQFLALCTKQC